MYSSWQEFVEVRHNKSKGVETHQDCNAKLVILKHGPHFAKLVCVDHDDAFITWIKEGDIATLTRIFKRNGSPITIEKFKPKPKKHVIPKEELLSKIHAMRKELQNN